MEGKKKKRNLLFPFVVLILFILACIQCFRLNNQIGLAKEQKKIQQEENEKLRQENEELKESLKRKDDPEYLEQLARDQFGYVSPGEKDFYDTSK